MRRRVIPVLLGVGLLGLALLASACGGGASLPTFDEPVKGDRVDAESFLQALSGSFRSGSTARVSFEVRGGGAGLAGGGSVRYTADDVDASLKVDDWKVDGASIDIRTVGGTTYMRVPESRGLWVNLSEGGPGVPGADLAEDADPRQSIGDLRERLSEVRFGGTETVNGIRARRFQVVSDAASDSGRDSDVPSVTQYWFDRRNRVVRRESELAQGSSATFTWSNWGKPVTISRPAEDAVITVTRLEQLRREQQPAAGGSAE